MTSDDSPGEWSGDGDVGSGGDVSTDESSVSRSDSVADSSSVPDGAGLDEHVPDDRSAIEGFKETVFGGRGSDSGSSGSVLSGIRQATSQYVQGWMWLIPAVVGLVTAIFLVGSVASAVSSFLATVAMWVSYGIAALMICLFIVVFFWLLTKIPGVPRTRVFGIVAVLAVLVILEEFVEYRPVVESWLDSVHMTSVIAFFGGLFLVVAVTKKFSPV